MIPATALTAALDLDAIIRALERRIRAYGGPAVVAVSGGVDSAVVLALAVRALGPPSVTAVTAVSPSLGDGELEAAVQVARDLGVRHRTIRTREVEREAYARNDELRCFHCKTELFATLRHLLAEEGGDGAVVLAGANADDPSDLRPGLVAGERAGVPNPLLEEGVGKATVRAIARELGLGVADKPALACLSSRVQIGIRITPDLLAAIDAAERRIRAMGFEVVRVRHRGDRATIEVPAGEVEALLGHPGLAEALDALREMGWREVSVDPLGYRQGGANVPPGAVNDA